MNTEIRDGYTIDTDTGEVLGLAGDNHFRVNSRNAAEWVLEKMGACTSAIDAIDKREVEILHNLSIQRKAFQRRTAWLEFRFGDELRTWAESQLDGKKKSIQLDFGKLGFRQTKGSVKVSQPAAAAMWLKYFCEQAVQMEPKILVSQIPESLRDELPRDLFEVTPAENKFYITT